MEEATTEDIMLYLAARNLEAKEQIAAQNRAKARAKAKAM